MDSPYDGVITSDIDLSTWIAEERFPSDRIWSPTQLETYATCPFRFFLERVIRLTPLKEVDLTLSSADKGTLIHQTLCDFFSEWCREESRQITPKNLETALSLLKKYATDNSEKFRFHSPAWYATIQALIGDGDVPGLLDRFVQKEADRENSSLTPFAFELDIKTEPSREGDGDSVPYVTLDHGEGEPVRIQGRIDRVDCSREGFFAIIDYKTGITYPKAIDIAEGSALQLPLYILALEKMYQETNIPMTGIAGSYCEISRKIKQTWPLLSPDHKSLVTTRKVKATADFRMVLQGSLDAARRHICGIRAGSFPLTQSTCTILNYCEYRNICRYDRFRVSEQEEEGEE
jgi:ATP-dependent helicase/DNAse subunit B